MKYKREAIHYKELLVISDNGLVYKTYRELLKLKRNYSAKQFNWKVCYRQRHFSIKSINREQQGRK